MQMDFGLIRHELTDLKQLVPFSQFIEHNLWLEIEKTVEKWEFIPFREDFPQVVHYPQNRPLMKSAFLKVGLSI